MTLDVPSCIRRNPWQDKVLLKIQAACVAHVYDVFLIKAAGGKIYIWKHIISYL